MTATQHPTHEDTDPARLAADARSILACPASVSLVIEGETYVIEDESQLGITDRCGIPTLVCPVDSPVARAAAGHASAIATVASGLGPRDSVERQDTLTLAGRLEKVGEEHCDCCEEVRDVVSLRLNFVLLTRPVLAGDPGGPRERQLRIPLPAFHSREHLLNRGHLQRSVEHANDCHQQELRQTVALATGTRPAELIAVSLADLTPTGVALHWVDLDGANRREVTFPRAARSLPELSEMLRRGLHAGIC